jgi:cytochrome c peroxidase
MAGVRFLSRSQHIAETAMRRYDKLLMDEAARMSREEEQGLESVALAVE